MRSCVAVLATVAVLSSLGFSASTAASARDEVSDAIARLEVEKNYSWQTVLPGGTATIDGQSESAGYTVIQMNATAGPCAVASHGSQQVIETPYGWLSPNKLRKKRQPETMRALCSPVQELQNFAEDCGGFTIAGSVATGFFGRDAAEKLWRTHEAIMGASVPAPAAGERRFVLQDVSYGPPSGRIEISVSRGQVTGYQLHLERTMRGGFTGRPSPVHWVFSTTIHSVGKTKVVVPPEAKVALDELDKS